MIFARRGEFFGSAVCQSSSGDILIGAAAGIEPSRFRGAAQARHVDGEGSRSGNIDHRDGTVLGLSRGRIIAFTDAGINVAECAIAAGKQFMVLVGNEVLPGQRGKKFGPYSELLDGGRVNLFFPAICEGPRVLIAVPLAEATGECCPVEIGRAS